MRPALLLVAAAVLVSLSCSLMPLEGDKLFEADRLEDAASSYQSYLERHPSGARQADRALYHLGLIYALPDSPLYDLGRAEDVLQTLLDLESGGLYARQAALILSYQVEVSRLREEAGRQATIAARLEEDLDRLEDTATQAANAAGEQEERARQLTARIQQLRSEIEQLTAALDKRTKELERIKEIDLRRMP